jgi:hypothetical protein
MDCRIDLVHGLSFHESGYIIEGEFLYVIAMSVLWLDDR